MATKSVTRRTLLQSALATSAFGASMLAAPFVRGAHAAGKLSLGFWDHWVPGANDAMTAICNEWAAKEKVDLTIDFITSNGDKLILTAAAEAQAKSGHDILTIGTWYAIGHADVLEPVDDVVKTLSEQNGKVVTDAEYLGTADGHWIATPAIVGTQTKPPCARIDLMKQFSGLDVTKMYPAGGPPDKELTEQWNWDFFLKAAEQCFKGGYPFGMPMGQSSTDATDWVGSVFASHGAQLVDKDGNSTVKSDKVRQVLEWFKKAVPFFPPDVFAWDDAGNNKWLISGKGALIMNPPSATRRRSASSCGLSRRPRDRRGGSNPACPITGGYGASPRTNRRPRACCCICRRARRPNGSWRRAMATICRRGPTFLTLRPGTQRARLRARFTATRRDTRTRSSISRARRHQRRSPIRSTCRRR
jgi:ABC-type glycerol-3-phosphate transport system substrate-binding protein